jgi:hypothetical protein
MSWIDINKKQPPWYTNVELKVKGTVEQHWHRLSGDDDKPYYGSLQTNRVILEVDVSHWRLLTDII